MDGGVARAAQLVDVHGCCLGLVAQGNPPRNSTLPAAPRPKRALAVTNKTVKDAYRSKKICSLKEHGFNYFSVGASFNHKH